MRPLKNIFARHLGFRGQLFLIMFPAVIYVLAACACLEFASINAPDLKETEIVIQRVKEKGARGDYGSKPQIVVGAISDDLHILDDFRTGATRAERLVARIIATGLIFQICIAFWVYCSHYRNTTLDYVLFRIFLIIGGLLALWWFAQRP